MGLLPQTRTVLDSARDALVHGDCAVDAGEDAPSKKRPRLLNLGDDALSSRPILR